MRIGNRFFSPLLVLFLHFGAISPAQASGQFRFGIDPTVNLTKLLRTQQVAVTTIRSGSTLTSDASAVMKVNFDKLLRASIDYEHYVAMGMPNTKECHIVEQGSKFPTVVWTKMSMSGVDNIGYLDIEAEEMPEVGEGAVGLKWSLVPKKAAWPYPSQPAFDAMDGSWYIEQLDSQTLYARYFLQGTLSKGLPLPGFLIDLIVRDQFEAGVRQVVEILRAEAKR